MRIVKEAMLISSRLADVGKSTQMQIYYLRGLGLPRMRPKVQVYVRLDYMYGAVIR